jgi:calcium-translocating P-type ATPase
MHRLTPDEALRALHSGPEGLSEAEAARRLAEFGPNDVERVAQPSLVAAFARQFNHFLAWILWVAAALCAAAEVYNPGAGMGVLGAAIAGVIAINGGFSFWQEYRAERALEALERLLPDRVAVVRGGAAESIDARGLVPGDVVLLEAGDRVPADCRILRAFGIRTNNATITGESVAVALEAGACDAPGTDSLRAANVALAGTSVVSGRAEAVVFATGGATELSRIAGLAQRSEAPLSPLQREIRHVSRLIALVATGLGAAFFAIGSALGLPVFHNVLFAIGIIVANVPEGLLPTITLSLAMAAQRMARRNALVRHLPSVEALGAATAICTDKTGTLTQSRMAVRSFLLGAALREVAADGTFEPVCAADRRFLEACLFCEDLRENGASERHEWLGDPMEVALVEAARRALPDAAASPRVDEIPFDSDRRRLSTLHRSPEGLVLYTKGALEALLPLCERVADGEGDRPLQAADRERFSKLENELAERGLRMLALAWRPVAEGEARAALERGLVLLGLVALEDPPRPEVPDAIRRCREAGIRVIMVTGDHPRTALAIARQIGLVTGSDPRVIAGGELRLLSDARLQLALDLPEIVFARVDADQKTRIVAALQRKGEVVAVTGDGVNDAPALRLADIGVAMGRDGTDAARVAADLVLADDNFATIVAAVEEGRAVYANIRKFLTYILTSNVPEIVPYLAFVLFRIPLPLTVLQILAVDLGTDMLPALALGAERADPDTMRRPPRRRSERLLSRALLARAYGFLGPLEACVAMLAYFWVLRAGGWSFGESLGPSDPLYLQATTACLAGIVAAQVANAYACRSECESVLRSGLRGNRLLLGGIAFELALLAWIAYTGAGNRIFATRPLPAEVWLLLPALALGMLGLEELRKLWIRRARL